METRSNQVLVGSISEKGLLDRAYRDLVQFSDRG